MTTQKITHEKNLRVIRCGNDLVNLAQGIKVVVASAAGEVEMVYAGVHREGDVEFIKPGLNRKISSWRFNRSGEFEYPTSSSYSPGSTGYEKKLRMLGGFR